MGLPVLATNWSGPTAFMTEHNSYPIPIEGLEAVGLGPWEGHMWAKPSVPALAGLLRRVVERPAEALERGRRAREDMVGRFSPPVVARMVLGQLRRIEGALRAAGRLPVGSPRGPKGGGTDRDREAAASNDEL